MVKVFTFNTNGYPTGGRFFIIQAIVFLKKRYTFKSLTSRAFVQNMHIC